MPRQGWDGRRRAAVACGLGLLVAVAGAIANARPFDLEDQLRREAFGAVSVSPDGRWLLAEYRRGLDDAERFDHGRFNTLFRTEIMVADLSGAGGWRTLVPRQPGYGYAAGPIAPDGARGLVYRLSADRWELGVATFATGEVRWLGIAPEIGDPGRTVQWRGPTEVLAIALAPGRRPADLRAARPQAGLPALWAATARGETAVTAVGSGRYQAVRPPREPRRLLAIDVVTGGTRALAAGDFVDLEASPSGRHVALLEAGPEIGLVASQPPQAEFGTAVRRLRLKLLDLQTGQVRAPCATCDVLSTLLSWSGAPERLVVHARPDGAAWRDGRVTVVDPATGAWSPISGIMPAVARRPERVPAGWWGGEPLVFGRLPGGNRDDWFRVGSHGPVRLTGQLAAPPRETLTVAGPALLAVADAAAWRIDRTGHATRLARDIAPTARRGDGIPSRTSYALGAAPSLAVIAQAHGRPMARALGLGGLHGGVDLADGATLMALRAHDGVVVRTAGGGAEALVLRGWGGARDLARINDQLRDAERPEPLAVPHRGASGEPLVSWLYLPVIPRTPGRPPPLVVAPYPGANHVRPPQIWDDGPMAAPAVLLGAGYAVLVPSLPSPKTGAGPSDGLADRVLAIVDAAAAQPALRGRFDPARLGIWGHSFGGYGVLAIAGQTDRFRAVVASAARSDLVSAWGQFTPWRRIDPSEGLSTPWSAGWTESLQGGMRAPPWADPERYRRNSPLMSADRIRTPVLLAVGELDGSHLGQAEEMFSALYRQGKDALLLTYWGEPHLFGSPGNLRDFYRRGFDFLDAQFAAAGVTTEAARPGSHREPASASGAPSSPAPPP